MGLSVGKITLLLLFIEITATRITVTENIENILVYDVTDCCVDDNALSTVHAISIVDTQPSLGMRLSCISYMVSGTCDKRGYHVPVIS